MSGNTPELSLKTAVDADDTADYLTLSLASSLTTVDALFNSTTGHTHSGAHQGGPVAPATGSITSAMIADGTIATVDIAAGAITQRVGRGGTTVNPQTTSGVFVDLPEMAVTITTAGGDLLVWLVGSFNEAAVAQTVTIALAIDGAAEVVAMGMAAPGVGYGFCISTVNIFAPVSAGSHTIKGRWNTNGSTATAIGTQRVIEVLEIKR